MAQNYGPRITTENLLLSIDPSQNTSYPAFDLPIKNGLVMWMDAADDSTFSYSSGTTVSQWRDKSGFNYHMVPTAPLSTGPSRNTSLNSRKTLTFTTAQSIGSLTFTVETSANTVFVVSRLTGGANARVLTAYYNNWLLGHWGGLVNPYYAEGWVYYSPNAADTVWRIYMGEWGGPSNDVAAAYSNGTVLNFNTDQASAGPKGLGINYQSGEPSNCEAAEIIVFNRLLSTRERNLIHTYLGQKWGISNTDRQIFDLSGNNFNFSFNGTNPRYNSKTIISNFNTSTPYAMASYGGQNLTSRILNLLYTNHTIEVALNPKAFAAVIDYNAALNYEFGQGIVLWTGYHSGLYLVGPTLYYVVWDASTNAPGVSYNAVGYKDKIMYISARRSGNILSLYINGILVAGPTDIGATASRTYTQINIGAAFQGDPSTNGFAWASQHEFHLLRMYDRALTNDEIFSNYQAFKARFDNNIVRFGLVLDLDAGNPTSYAGAGTTWYDVSGNSYNGTLTGGPVYSTDGGGAFLFSGNYSLSPVSTVNSLNGNNLTVEAWVKHNTFGGAGTGRSYISNWHSFNVNNQRGFILRTFDADTYPRFWWCWGGGNNYDAFGPSSYVMQTGRVYHIVATYEKNVAVKIYINGNLEGTGTNSIGNTIAFDTSNGLYVGFSNINSSYMDGNIYSARLYNRTLTAAEVLQNYNATKGRFGL